jgi:hypothetical protein
LNAALLHLQYTRIRIRKVTSMPFSVLFSPASAGYNPANGGDRLHRAAPTFPALFHNQRCPTGRIARCFVQPYSVCRQRVREIWHWD